MKRWDIYAHIATAAAAAARAYAQRQKWFATIEFNIKLWMIQYAMHEMCDGVWAARFSFFFVANCTVPIILVCIGCSQPQFQLAILLKWTKIVAVHFDWMLYSIITSDPIFFRVNVEYIESMHAYTLTERNIAMQ